MPTTVTYDTISLDALLLTQDDSGNITGMVTYTVSSSTSPTFVRQRRIPMTFSPTEQTQIRTFVANKIAQIKAADGI